MGRLSMRVRLTVVGILSIASVGLSVDQTSAYPGGPGFPCGASYHMDELANNYYREYFLERSYIDPGYVGGTYYYGVQLDHGYPGSPGTTTSYEGEQSCHVYF